MSQTESKRPIKLCDPRDCKVKCGRGTIRRTVPWFMRQIRKSNPIGDGTRLESG